MPGTEGPDGAPVGGGIVFVLLDTISAKDYPQQVARFRYGKHERTERNGLRAQPSLGTFFPYRTDRTCQANGP